MWFSSYRGGFHWNCANDLSLCRNQDKPTYRPGLWACIACCLLNIILVCILDTSFYFKNKAADRGECLIEADDVSLPKFPLPCLSTLTELVCTGRLATRFPVHSVGHNVEQGPFSDVLFWAFRISPRGARGWLFWVGCQRSSTVFCSATLEPKLSGCTRPGRILCMCKSACRGRG